MLRRKAPCPSNLLSLWPELWSKRIFFSDILNFACFLRNLLTNLRVLGPKLKGCLSLRLGYITGDSHCWRSVSAGL